MMIKILGALIVLVLAFLAVASMQPATYAVSASENIKATPEKIFPYINDFAAWSQWSPFEKDPNMKKTLSTPSSGLGASMAWDGDRQVGQGRSTISESVASSKILMNMEMIKPMASLNNVEFTLESQGDSTKVTWAMSGNRNFVGKMMGLLGSNAMATKMFQEGLSKLKTLVEAP